MARRSHIAAAIFCASTLASTSQAADVEVSGDVIGQGYDVVSPWGDRVVGRRRLTSMLGFAVYDLEGDDDGPFSGDYSVQLRMRVDADFGIAGAERSFSPGGGGTRYVPTLAQAPVDLMYGYVEGRNVGGGVFGFKVGRQYVTDVLGWWSFDGGLVRVTTPFFLRAEVYAGLEQRGGLPLSTSRYEQQGVWRGAAGDLDQRPQEFPSYQFASQAPAFGVALETDGPNWIHGRLTYRRVYNSGEAFTGQFPIAPGDGFERVSGLRISSDRLGYAATAFLSEIGSIRGGFAYDFYNDLASRAYGGIELYPVANQVTVGAEIDYYVPTFDADSIWNWFTHNPTMTGQLRAAAGPFDGFTVTASGGLRLWMTDGDPAGWAVAQCSQSPTATPSDIALCLQLGYLTQGSPTNVPFGRDEADRTTHFAPDALGNLGAEYQWFSGQVGFNGMLQLGVGDESQDRGRRLGGAVSAKQALFGEVVWLGGRVSVYDWSDPTRADRDATSFTYVVAPEYRPWDVTRFRFEWEHSMNRLVGQRFRLLGLASFTIDP